MKSNAHLTDDQLIGDIYRTLSDSDREVINAHLVECRLCRERHDRQRFRHGRIDQEILSSMNIPIPPERMKFDAIAPRLHRRGFRFLYPVVTDSLPVAFTLAGLFLAVTGAIKMGRTPSALQNGLNTSALPTLACFCLMFVSMDQFDRSFTLRPRFIFAALIAGLLWVGTAILGFLNLITVRDIALILLTNAGRSAAEAGFGSLLAVYLGVMGFIGLVIGGAEYHIKRIGHPSSWKVFIWTLVIQLLVFFTPYLLW